ncbi:pilus biogenesis protein [Spirochaetia bacterium]|nr:pilus biogenesis protein [Spirochaetia bacterium]
MQNTVLIDSGPLIALFDKNDAYHTRIDTFLNEHRFQYTTTVAVITEVSHMIDFSVDVQIDFFRWVLNNGVVLFPIVQADLGRIIELTKKYADRPMDFADATLVIAAEKTGIRSIISIDADFNIYRLTGKVRIVNVFTQ